MDAHTAQAIWMAGCLGVAIVLGLVLVGIFLIEEYRSSPAARARKRHQAQRMGRVRR